MLHRLSQLGVSSDFILGILPCAVVPTDVMNGISASQPTEDRYGDQEAFDISSEVPEVECPHPHWYPPEGPLVRVPSSSVLRTREGATCNGLCQSVLSTVNEELSGAM